MKTFVICNTKGGTGKTTTALLLALSFQRHGTATAVLDLNGEQRTATMRGTALGLNVCTEASGLPSCQILLIDTAPQLSDASLRAACKYVTDPSQGSIVVVMRPTVIDFEATLAATKRLKLLGNPAVRLLFNQVRTSSFYGKNRDIFAQGLGITPLKSFLRQRSCYEAVMEQGWGAMKRRPEAQADILSLQAELMGSAEAPAH